MTFAERVLKREKIQSLGINGGCMSEFIGIEELAEILGCSRKTIQNRISTGDVPKYYKPGRRVLFDTREVDDWIRSHQVRSTKFYGGHRDD